MKKPRLPRYAVITVPVDYLKPADPEVVGIFERKQDAIVARDDAGKRSRIYDLRTGKQLPR